VVRWVRFFYFFSSLNIAAGSFKFKGKTDESKGIVLVLAIKKRKMSVFRRYQLSCIPVLFHLLHSYWGQRNKPVHFSQEQHPFHLNYWQEWVIDLCLLCQQWFPTPPPFFPLRHLTLQQIFGLST